MNIITGYRYQIYDGDDLKIYRLIRYINEDTVLLKNQDDPSDTAKIAVEELNNKYVKLNADALMNLMITDVDSAKDSDVYVCINKTTNLAANSNTPDLICNQCAYNGFKNMYDTHGNIYVGDCVTTDTAMGGSIVDYFTFKEISYTASMAIYVDDTIDTIINAISPVVMKRINAQLSMIKSNNAMHPTIIGYVDNLKDLLVNNDFIIRYREIFNIAQTSIMIDPNNVDSTGSIILTEEHRKFIEDMIRQYIHIVKVIKYGKDIDVSKIVSLKHIMISDESQTIYLVAYEVIGDYVIDEDIAKAMKVKNYRPVN